MAKFSHYVDTVEKVEIYSPHIKKYFVKSITYLVISLVEMSLSRNFSLKRMRINFRTFHYGVFLRNFFSLPFCIISWNMKHTHENILKTSFMPNLISRKI